MYKRFEGMAIEDVLQEVEEMGVEYEYEAETEDCWFAHHWLLLG